MGHLRGILGLLTMLVLAYAFSTSRRSIRVKTVAWGLGLQIVFAWFVLRFPAGQKTFQVAKEGVTRLLGYSYAGSHFVFGDLANPDSKLGYFAFGVLPTVIFIAAFFAVLYHVGIMQIIIRVFAWVMTRLMGASGAESLNVAASVFMGQTEAPLTIRPFLPELTRSELMTVMTSGMAHVSGGIMAAYIGYGIDAGHLLSAVIMTAPGTLVMAKMLVPETEAAKTAGKVVMSVEEEEAEKKENLIGAIARGTTDGLGLARNIAAMLISFLALIALIDGIFGGIHHHFWWFPESLEKVLGVIFSPVAWLIGIPRQDCSTIGSFLGTRMVANELLAYKMLGAAQNTLDPRSFAIATFALCGFANLSSIGIQIGGIGALAPNKRGELARLGVRAMLAGTMANLMSASIAGILL